MVTSNYEEKGRVPWLRPVIPALWEAKAGGSPELLGRLRQENRLNLRAMNNLRRKFKNPIPGQVQWLTPVIPALWEAEAGRSQGQEFEISLTNMNGVSLYCPGRSNFVIFFTETRSHYVAQAGLKIPPQPSKVLGLQIESGSNIACRGAQQHPQDHSTRHQRSSVGRKLKDEERDPRWPVTSSSGLQLPVKAQRASGRHTYRYIFAAHGPGHSQWKSPTGRQRDPFGWRGFFAGASARRLLVRSKRD
ncbi:NANOG neighbor homeobox [Plecturocebus cupreus]